MVKSPILPDTRRSSDCASVNVVTTMLSSGTIIRQNRMTRLIRTIMLNGLVTTFRIWFFSRRLLNGRRFFALFTLLNSFQKLRGFACRSFRQARRLISLDFTHTFPINSLRYKYITIVQFCQLCTEFFGLFSTFCSFLGGKNYTNLQK